MGKEKHGQKAGVVRLIGAFRLLKGIVLLAVGFGALKFLHQDVATQLENWLQQNQTGLKMIRAVIPADWKVGDKTGRSGDGATNDIAIARPPSGGPIFVAIYTVDPADNQDARNQLVADVAKAALDALKK